MPDNKGIPKGKKRYTLTLTESTMNRLHVYVGKNNIQKSFISSMVDDLLCDVLSTFDELEKAQARKGKTIGLGDLFSTIGKIMTDKDDEQEKLL